MALIIAQSKIRNSSININNFYVRLDFFAYPNGNLISASLRSYENKKAFDEKKSIFTEVPDNLEITLLNGDEQSISNVHKYAQERLLELGIVSTIEL